MKIEGVVGAPSSLGDGSERPLLLTRYGGLSISAVAARYAEAVSRGRVFRAQTDSSGVAPGTAIGTSAPFALYNPAGSGVNLVLLDLSMGYHSGTLGAGYVSICANTNVLAAAVTGTAITAVNALLGSGNTAVGQAFDAATLPAAPTVIGAFCSLTALLASTAVAPYTVYQEVAGSIIVGPGATVSLEADAAAGTSPLVVFGATWEEVPA